MAVTFTLGLAALFDDPTDETPGGYCRDELLFHVRDEGRDLSSHYVLREVLSADLPMACGSEDDRGDLVVMAGDGVGGVVPPEAAEHLLQLCAAMPKRATLDVSPDVLGLTPRAILVPDVYPDVDFSGPGHPFEGMRVRSARDVRAAVRAHGRGEVDDVIAMLNLCAVHGFVVAARATTEA